MVRDEALSICWFMLGRTEIKNYMQSILYHVLSQLQNLSIKSVGYLPNKTLYMITICKTRGTLACISLHACMVTDATK